MHHCNILLGKVMEVSGDFFYKNVRGSFLSGWQRHNWPALMGFALYGQSDILNSLLALFFCTFRNQSGWFSPDCEFRHRKIKESLPFTGTPSSAGAHQAAQSQMLQAPHQVATSQSRGCFEWDVSYSKEKSTVGHNKWDLPKSHQTVACFVGFLKH